MMSSIQWADISQWLMAAAPFAGRTRAGDSPPGGEGNGGSGPPAYSPDIRRIMEGLIPASVVGILVLYGTVQVIGTDIEHCQQRLERLDQIIEMMRRDVYRPQWDRFQDMPLPQGLQYNSHIAEYWI